MTIAPLIFFLVGLFAVLTILAMIGRNAMAAEEQAEQTLDEAEDFSSRTEHKTRIEIADEDEDDEEIL